MIVKINGVPCSRATGTYEKFVDYHDRCGFYTPLDKAADMIRESNWYQQDSTPALSEFERVQAYCGDIAKDPFCYMDAMNRTIMESTPITEAIYKFISHRAAVIRWGVENNFNPFDMELTSWIFTHLV